MKRFMHARETRRSVEEWIVFNFTAIFKQIHSSWSHLQEFSTKYSNDTCTSKFFRPLISALENKNKPSIQVFCLARRHSSLTNIAVVFSFIFSLNNKIIKAAFRTAAHKNGERVFSHLKMSTQPSEHNKKFLRHFPHTSRSKFAD